MKIFIVIIGSALFLNTSQAWDTSLKADISQKTTDNVNASSTTLVGDKIKNLSAYIQTKDENDRLRLRVKATRYDKTTDNDSNVIEGSYQRKFDRDLSDSFLIKFFNEKYTATPTIYGDTNSNNKGGELQITLTRPLDKTLSLSSSYSVNYKDYFNSPPRKDIKLETNFGFEKIIKNILTISPEMNVSLNNSKDNYYSTFSFGGNIYAGLELSEKFDTFINYSWGKVNYNNRTFTITKNLRTLSFKEEVTNSSFEMGLNFYPLEWLSLDARFGNTKSDSNNTSNSFKSNEWSAGVGFKF